MVAAGSAVGAPAPGRTNHRSISTLFGLQPTVRRCIGTNSPGEGEATWTVAAAAPTEPHDAPSHKLASPWRKHAESTRLPAHRRPRPASRTRATRIYGPPTHTVPPGYRVPQAGSPAVGIVAAPSNLCSHEPARNDHRTASDASPCHRGWAMAPRCESG